MNKKIARHEVTPNEGEDYSDGFYSSLYNTKISMGLNEQRLIWTRYAGFLILEGFVINALKLESNSFEQILLLSVVGIICSVVWHILNHAGWLNQNVWFAKAASLSFSSVKVPMPTDWWVNHRALKPTGRIYNIAQLVPICFILVYAYATSHALASIMSSTAPVVNYLITAFLLVAAFSAFMLVERAEYKDRKEIEDDRPLS